MRLRPVLLLLPSLFKWFGHILFLYKHKDRCDAHVFSMISHHRYGIHGCFILVLFKPAAFLMRSKQSFTGGACTRMLKYQCAGVNQDTGWIKLMETKRLWYPKITNGLPLC